jgi:hypothetical protein
VKSSRPKGRCCAICGSTFKVEEHHLGGRQHARFFTVPLCQPHHREVTIMIQRAGVQMESASDEMERLRRVTQAVAVFQWFVSLQIQRKEK